MKVSVKHQRSVYPDLELDMSQPPEIFKAMLFSLTGVPIERQKVMVKGGLLKDDWGKLKIKEGATLIMMGSAEAKPLPTFDDEPKEDPKDIDMDEHEEEPAHGNGLSNLGNTCYMNSTIQCLYSIDELKAALQMYSSTSTLDPSAALTMEAKNLFSRLDKSDDSVAPDGFLNALRVKYPQFAQQGAGGMYMQQDAEECYTQILNSMREKLDGGSGEDSHACVKELFGIDLETSLKCEETSEESSEKQTVYTLKCNISQDVNHLNDGVKLSLVEDREKMSEALGRMTVFKGNSAITKLPKYLTVQLVRFLYRRDTQQKAKILRRVTFPMRMDVFEFGGGDLKQKMQESREVWEKAEDAKAEAKKTKLEAGAEESKSNGRSDKFHTGFYDLHAIITHKGRIADSGHYVSWVKQKNGEWLEFDDDRVIPVSEEDIGKLTGGGDWHMAYLCIYKSFDA